MPNVGGMLDFQDTRRLAALRCRFGNGGLECVEIAADRHQEPFAGFREREFAGRSLKEPYSEIAFEHRHVSADRGCSQSQPASSFRKTAAFSGSHERFEVRQSFHIQR
jgi:hypothetical protein